MTRFLYARLLCAKLLCVSLALIGAGLPSGAETTTKLTVAKVANDFALMMVDYGNKLGTFRNNGLDVTVAEITQAKMIQAVVAGSIDMALGSGAVLAFRPKGAPLMGVAALSGPPSILVLIVRADGAITALDQLRGRVVAVSNLGSLTDWAVSQIARHQNWAPSDITRASVGDTMARVAALKVGNVDAAVLDIATALELEHRGQAKILVNFGDLITNFQNQIIYASDALIKTNPGAVTSFNRGWFETIDYARAHKSETAAFAAQDLGVSASVADSVYDKLMPAGFFSTDGRFDRAALDSMSKGFVEMKLTDRELDLSQYVTERFLPKE